MYKEMTVKFNNDIDEDLRKELATGKLTGVHANTAKYHEFRGIAMLEIGNLDIELNINCDVDDDSDAEIVTAFPDYFICVKSVDPNDPDGTVIPDWESYGYADDYIGDSGTAHVDWSAENWEELLFTDMLKSLAMFADKVRPRENLTFLSPTIRPWGGE